MAKKQKTRKQKILAENRKEKLLFKERGTQTSPESHTSNEQPSSPSQYVFKMKDTRKISKPKSPISSAHDYTHLKKDLVKTGILTTSIVVAQFVLYFILQ